MKKGKSVSFGKNWLKQEMRPYTSRIVLLTILTVVTTVFSLAFAYVVQFLINSATDKNSVLLWGFAAVILGLLLLKILCKTLTGYLTERYRAYMISKLRVKSYAKLLNAEYSSLQKYHSGDILTRLTSDIQEVCATTVGFMPAVSGMLVQCVGAIVALCTIDPLFTLIYVVCGGLFAGITALFRKHIKKRQKAVLEADGQLRSYMQEGYASSLTLKAYSAVEKITDKADALATTYYKKRLNRNVVHSSMSFVYGLLSNFGLIFAVVWCSVSVLNGYDNYGSILSVILLLMQLQHPLSGFSSLVPAYYGRIASGERLAEIDNLPSEKSNVDTNCNLQYSQIEKIHFDSVEFSYDRECVLEKLDLTLNKGETVCLVGASGAGKSTLFKLLLSVYAPTQGKISFIGSFGDDTSFPLSVNSRSLFAYVPQGNFLFSGTIYENLTFFTEENNKEKLDKDIAQALQVACAEFVNELPNGLQTKLGEGGAGLSEGQMQRLSIARAVLSNRPILLLDEATSALDADTEKMVLKNIKALKDKTCFIVTHRPAALAIADRVLEVDKGKIIEKK